MDVERSGETFGVPVAYQGQNVVAIDCGWAADTDAALDADRAGRLLDPVEIGSNERITAGAKLARWLFDTDEPPRYVLLLHGGVVILADRLTWAEGRYLAVSLDTAIDRADQAELETIAALFSADVLQPPAEGGSEQLAHWVDESRKHAVGVSGELREGLRESVQIIANEVLDRIRSHGLEPGDVAEPGDLARELGRDALRYLYRILFLLYAEARPELGILPADDQDYVAGYSMQRLGELAARRLIGEEARTGFHLYESLDLLFRMVNDGHRARGNASTEGLSEGEGLRFESLKADLFEPSKTRLIGRIPDPRYDDEAPLLDTRLRDEALYKVLRRLMLAKGSGRKGKNQRGGFISYAQLGINQLGAVYEGLMSYTGFIAAEELYEVAKKGDPSGGSWMIPASKVPGYTDDVFVMEKDENGFPTGERVRYRPGSFVYRLAGRDRQTSASYYTPHSLTSVTVQLALEQRIKEEGRPVTAAEVLRWRVCEPALGSGAFLNEAIDQLAALYLRLREEETGDRLEPDRARPRAAEDQGVHRPAQLLRRRPERDRRRARRGLDLAQRHAPRPPGPLVRPAPGPRQLPDRRRAAAVPAGEAGQGGVAEVGARGRAVLRWPDPGRAHPPLPAARPGLGCGRGGEGGEGARPRGHQTARRLAQGASASPRRRRSLSGTSFPRSSACRTSPAAPSTCGPWSSSACASPNGRSAAPSTSGARRISRSRRRPSPATRSWPT